MFLRLELNAHHQPKTVQRDDEAFAFVAIGARNATQLVSHCLKDVVPRLTFDMGIFWNPAPTISPFSGCVNMAQGFGMPARMVNRYDSPYSVNQLESTGIGQTYLTLGNTVFASLIRRPPEGVVQLGQLRLAHAVRYAKDNFEMWILLSLCDLRLVGQNACVKCRHDGWTDYSHNQHRRQSGREGLTS